MDKADIAFSGILVLIAVYAGVTFQFLAGGLLMVAIALCWLAYKPHGRPGSAEVPWPVVLLCGLVLAYSVITMQLLAGIIAAVLILVAACVILPAAGTYRQA